MGQPFDYVQSVFNRGELSPRMVGRVDNDAYYKSVKYSQNMMPYPQGAFTKRPGTQYVSEVKNSANDAILVPFRYSTVQNYILEFGDLYFRVYRNRGQVETTPGSGVPYEVVTPWPQSILRELKYVQSADTLYVFHKDYQTRVITRAADNSWSIGLLTYQDGPYLDINTTATTITPSAATGNITLTASTAIFQASDVGRQMRIKVASNNWGWVVITAVTVPPSTVITGAANNGSGLIRITSTAHGLATGTVATISGVLGTTEANGTWTITNITANTFDLQGSAFVNAYISGGTVTAIRVLTASATVQSTLTATTATTQWRFGVFGGTDNIWPSVATIYEERLIVANTENYPSTLWASTTGEFTSTTANFRPSELSGTVTDANGFPYTIGDDQVNAINWFSPGTSLLIGTTGAEHSMTGGTSSTYAPLTPTNRAVRRQSRYGSPFNVRITRIGNAVLYCSPTGLKVREMYYEFGSDTFLSRDVTIFNDHITKTGIIDLDFQQEPDPIIWACRDDGQLLGFTYEKLQEVEGWHRHLIGGTNSKATAVACIPRPDQTGDDLWLIVSRTIGGSTKKYVEFMTSYFDPETNGQSSAFFVDSGLTYNGFRDGTLTPAATTGAGITFTASSAIFSVADVGRQIRYGTSQALITAYTNPNNVVATITTAFPNTNPIPTGSWSIATKTATGASHLNGETCAVFVDGGVTDDVEVSGGSFTIETFASVIHIGLGYSARAELLPIEAKQFNTVQGRTRRTHKVHIYVTSTLGLKVGGEAVQDTIPFAKMGESMNLPPPIFSGILTRHPPIGYDKQGIMVLESPWATPLTINYVVQNLEFNG